MAKFTMTIEADDSGEMGALMNLLFPFQGVTPAPARPAAEQIEEAAAETAKRTRRTKAQIEADNKVGTVEEGLAEEAASAPAPEPEVTLDMLKQAGTALMEKKDMGAVKAALAPFGANRFAEVKPEDMGKAYQSLLDAAK